MAVSGSGTQADPYIVDNWDDFLTVSGSSSNYVKFANPDRAITGDGSSSNPFVVSTYEEMLLKTGASYIHQVKLIDREAKKYKYGDVYCIYDDTLSFIDFNDIMPSGYNSDLTIQAHVDFNGWTLKNMAFNRGVLLRFATPSKGLILTNLYFLGRHSSGWLYIDSVIENFIINMIGVNDDANSVSVIHTPQAAGSGIVNSALSLKTTGKVHFLGRANNCILNFEADNTNYFACGDLVLDNTMATGSLDFEYSGSVPMFSYIYNSILDFDWKRDSCYPQITRNVMSPSFFNSEKMPSMGMTANNLYGATTEQLKDAQWLYDHGFPIGVD